MDPSTALLAVLAGGYAALMLFYLWGWQRLPAWSLPDTAPSPTFFSVLIPARNESFRIEACLDALLAIRYPPALWEVRVLDDGSTDDTAARVLAWKTRRQPAFDLQLLRLPARGKKAAISAGVAAAKGAFIVCTDADCVSPPYWLQGFDCVIRARPEAKAITGPVLLHEESGYLAWFQSLDLIGLMGVTGAGIGQGWHHMANGANLAYARSAFMEVNGYEGNAHIPSGDDFFLVQKIAARWPGSVVFLKSAEAAVRTHAMPDWRSFFQQRLRWGSKNAALPEWSVRLALAWVFVFCWALLGSGCWQAWLLKAGVDALFLYQVSHFFKKKKALYWFFPSQVLHVVYIAVMGVLSLLVKKYTWK